MARICDIWGLIKQPMFWIYTALFVAIVFVPSYVTSGFFSLSVVQVQEFVILGIGVLASTLFHFQNRTLERATLEKMDVERKANRTSRDLVNSYSYIGEINRKIDILREMVFEGPLAIKNAEGNEDEIFNSILEAIHTFTKSSSVAVRIVDAAGNVLREIKNENVVSFYVPKREYLEKFGACIENTQVCIVCSQLNEDGIAACIVISRQGGGVRKKEDIEIIKALASYALLLYMVFRKGRN